MPLLDYMGMKEVEDPEHPAPWPEAPEPVRPQFEAMLRFFCCDQPEAEDRALDALQKPYAQVGSCNRGFAFELCAKMGSVSITALETCGYSSDDHPVVATVYACDGGLRERLSGSDAWTEVGNGELHHKTASRIELARPVLVQKGIGACIYIHCREHFVGFAACKDGPLHVSAENEDLRVFNGVPSKGATPFQTWATIGTWSFNGKLSYKLLA